MKVDASVTEILYNFHLKFSQQHLRLKMFAALLLTSRELLRSHDVRSTSTSLLSRKLKH